MTDHVVTRAREARSARGIIWADLRLADNGIRSAARVARLPGMNPLRVIPPVVRPLF